jgi:hypothetical protein
VALGLYRLPGSKDNDMPYTCTNPEPATLVMSSDRVFVLGRDIPRDLLLDPKPFDTHKLSVGRGALSAKNKDNFYGINTQMEKQSSVIEAAQEDKLPDGTNKKNNDDL